MNCFQSKDELMIEELIAEELELQALSRQQAVSEEQQSQRLRQKQRDELIDELVSLLCYCAFMCGCNSRILCHVAFYSCV